jgi:hypothetical protein
MILSAVLCPRCHTDEVMKDGKTKGHICNTTTLPSRVRITDIRTVHGWPAILTMA